MFAAMYVAVHPSSFREVNTGLSGIPFGMTILSGQRTASALLFPEIFSHEPAGAKNPYHRATAIVERIAARSRYFTAVSSEGCGFFSFPPLGSPSREALFALEKRAVNAHAMTGTHTQFGALKICGLYHQAPPPISAQHANVNGLVSASKSAPPSGGAAGVGGTAALPAVFAASFRFLSASGNRLQSRTPIRRIVPAQTSASVMVYLLPLAV